MNWQRQATTNTIGQAANFTIERRRAVLARWAGGATPKVCLTRSSNSRWMPGLGSVSIIRRWPEAWSLRGGMPGGRPIKTPAPISDGDATPSVTMACDSATRGGVVAFAQRAAHLAGLSSSAGVGGPRRAFGHTVRDPRIAGALGHRRRLSRMVAARTFTAAERRHWRSALRLCRACCSTGCCQWRRARRQRRWSATAGCGPGKE